MTEVAEVDQDPAVMIVEVADHPIADMVVIVVKIETIVIEALEEVLDLLVMTGIEEEEVVVIVKDNTTVAIEVDHQDKAEADLLSKKVMVAWIEAKDSAQIVLTDRENLKEDLKVLDKPNVRRDLTIKNSMETPDNNL